MNNCPEWCTNHSQTEYAQGTAEHHRATLFATWLPARPDGSQPWVFHLYLSGGEAVATSDYDGAVWSPSIALMENRPDAMPRSLSADQARQMAAGLIRGAEIIEAGLTSTCAQCGTAENPADLFTEEGDVAPDGQDGRCLDCHVKQRRARRSSLHVVKEGAQA